jgi:hypothetical protein
MARLPFKLRLEVVRVLGSLGGGAMSVAENYPWTPALMAACNGHVEVVKMLASLGGDARVAMTIG